MLKRYKSLVLFLAMSCSLMAQSTKGIDEVFQDFMRSDFLIGVTDTLPNLFYSDSILLKSSLLQEVGAVTDSSYGFPVNVSVHKWKLFDFSMPRKASNSSVEISIEKRWFGRYDVLISIPLLNPQGSVRTIGRCKHDDSHYVAGASYSLKERKGVVIVMDCYYWLYLNYSIGTFL